ncbi:MAG: tetratricopeptide repeat protein [Treponema sp.]|nr:tetratricopeptide repeat protein [Treponema sp.]
MMTLYKGKIFCLIAFFSLLPIRAEAQTPPAPVTAMQFYRRGRDFEAMNRISEANSNYNEAIRVCLDEVSRNVATRDTYTAMTMTLQRQRRYADVISWGERGLRSFPDEYRIMEMMGEAFFYLDDYERSLSFMQRYANAMPEGERVSVAYFFIGEIFRITERFLHADIAYTTAVRMDPTLSLWWYRLGSVREAAGDRRPAIEAYQQALRLNPNYREARSGLNRLQ